MQYHTEHRGACAAAIAVALTALAVPADTVTVTIDKSATYQTIDGNGFMHEVEPWQDCNPFCADADITNLLDSLINVLGVTLHRVFINGCAFSESPGHFDIHGADGFFTQAQYLDSVAEAANEFYGVCPTVLSPPAYMKKNNKCRPDTLDNWPEYKGNTLYEDQYDDYGDFCATFVQTVVDTFGLVPYALSFQNEPCFNVAYDCCTYADGAHYGEMLAGAAPKVRALGLPTLFFGAEVVAYNYHSWQNAILNNAEAAPYLDRNAVHSYAGDGVNPEPTYLFLNLHPIGDRPLWVSEASLRLETDIENYEAALDYLGRRLALGYGHCNFSAWIQVGVYDNPPGSFYPGGGLIRRKTGVPGEPTVAYWMFAQFWRFIRPGMQRVAAEPTNDSLLVVAFKDERVSSMSVILTNIDTVDHMVRLATSGGSLPPQFNMKRTTESENFVFLGAVAPTDLIEVPARSIVSLGYNYIGTGVPRGHEPNAVRGTVRPATQGAGTAAHRHGTRIYDLRGRLVARGRGAMPSTRALAGAVYCVGNAGRPMRMIVR
jgi:O-glycosyl hydrolase